MIHLTLTPLTEASLNIVNAYPQRESAQAYNVSACNGIRMTTQLRWDGQTGRQADR